MNLADVRLDEFLRMMQNTAQPTQAPALAPAQLLPKARDLPENYRSMSPTEARARLRDLKSEAVQRASNQRWSDAESKEWAALTREHRMCLHLLAGIDGELTELALREWRELPGPERAAIKAEVRSLRAAMAGVFSLSGNW
ncbi:hypothetical protein [Comamonas antarctica]|uniref:Uncharacterized protein n=1 Tax=Comamonas antarctica TaxID=2743470 RepID=A0A6N1WYU0_9BURK|nr:hypothetical protein [Comamonas antarctica]QKV52369.1 hypothetical protein HUK68_05300 [Comamonas antarctica]